MALWVSKKVGDILTLEYGKPLDKELRTEDGMFPAYGANGIKCRTNEYYCDKPTLIIGRKGSAGEITFTEQKFWPLDVTYYVKYDGSKYDLKFIYFLLRNLNLPSLATGVKPGINRNIVYDIDISIPDITEQKRIVHVLELIFRDIEKAKVTANRNLQNAQELFDSSLQRLYSHQGKDWERVSLEELLERNWITSHLDGNHGSDYPKKSEFVKSGVPYISAKCIVNGSIDMGLAKYLTENRAKTLRKGIAQNKDVLFAHNATVGPVSILYTSEDKVILGTSLTYYRCNQEYILPEYLAQYMVSYEFVSQYSSVMRQSTRNQVPITKQREFIHVIPPIEKQLEVAKKLMGLAEELKELKNNYEKKLNLLNELEESLLKKALIGELTKSKGIAA